jgi:hypothetical protein
LLKAFAFIIVCGSHGAVAEPTNFSVLAAYVVLAVAAELFQLL